MSCWCGWSCWCVLAIVCLLIAGSAPEGEQGGQNMEDEGKTTQGCNKDPSSSQHCSMDTQWGRETDMGDVEVEDEEEEEGGDWLEEEEEEEAKAICDVTGVQRVRMQVHIMVQQLNEKVQEVLKSFQLTKKNAEIAKQDALLFANTMKALIKQGYQNTLKEIERQVKVEEELAVLLIGKMQKGVNELQKRGDELQRLSLVKNYESYLKHFPSLCTTPATGDWSSFSFLADPMEGTMEKVSAQLGDMLDVLIDSYTITEFERVRRCAVDVVLDSDTASPNLIVSDDGKQVKFGPTQQKLPNFPKRFDPVTAVLGKQGFFGRFYYEVQVVNKTEWVLGVAGESVTRKGRIVVSPENGYWAFGLMQDEYKALADTPMVLSPSYAPQKVGVFVDYRNGVVSFYDVEHESLLFSYRGVSFTEKLYPFFTPFASDDGLNSAPLVITPVSEKKSLYT